VRATGERANALLKETFAALQEVSLDPWRWRICAIAKAALVLLHSNTADPRPAATPRDIPYTEGLTADPTDKAQASRLVTIFFVRQPFESSEPT